MQMLVTWEADKGRAPTGLVAAKGLVEKVEEKEEDWREVFVLVVVS